jgi:hypothetical protein
MDNVIKFPLIEENEELQKELTYPQELERKTNRPLILQVHKPYKLSVEDGKTYIVAEWLEKWAKNPQDDILKKAYEQERNLHFYNPFERFDEDTFLKTIMEIEINNPESILNFYNQHGILGYPREATNDILANAINVTGVMEDYSFFRKEILTIKTLLMYHEAISNNDYDFFKDYLRKPKATNQEAILYGNRVLTNLLNENLEYIKPVVMISNDGTRHKGTTALCLVGVFYLRLYDIVTENQKIKKCRFCGDYFIPRKSDAILCPPPTANEPSKCKSRYDALVRRIVEWHFRDGLTVKEIQEKVSKPKSRSVKEIQSIIDNYKGKWKK